MRTPASTLSAARDDFTATSVEEVQAIMRARLAEERSKNPLVKAAEGLTNSPVEPIHDPLENTVGFPLTEWYYSFEINAFKTATRPTHKGSDFMAASGTPIYSIADGEVTFVGDFGGYGNVMYVDSEVNGVKVQIRYAHMLTPTSLKVGESVTKGQELGPVGQTGQASAPHIHLEILQDGEYVDPAAWLAVNAA